MAIDRRIGVICLTALALAGCSGGVSANGDGGQDAVADVHATSDALDSNADAPVETSLDAPGDSTMDVASDAATDSTSDAAGDAPAESAVPGCGDGVISGAETCDPADTGATDPRLRCDCNDGDPCTIDRCAAGTSAAACNCACEHVDGRTMHGIGTCDDGDMCTVDVARCSDPMDSRTVDQCVAQCAVACDNTGVAPQCQNICGNGVLNAGETCEVFVAGVSPATLPLCTCDDGNLCTLDVATGGAAATCDLACTHTFYAAGTYGVTSCDDAKSCTSDAIVSGSAATCDVVCSNDLVANWDTTACDDHDACTIDSVLTSDPATCAVTCDHTAHTGYPYPPAPGSGGVPCDDGIACTTDMVVSFDTSTCQYVCAHGSLGGYGHTTCDDGNACTVDSVTGGSPSTCNVTCSNVDISGNPDPVDDSFRDTNCDGIDGVAAQMIFVARSGSDSSGTGSRTAPFLTIGRGITAAASRGLHDVAVSDGSYPERVVLQSGISVHGGYHASSSWSRDGLGTLVTGGTIPGTASTEGLYALSINAATTIDWLNVTTSGGSESTYGVRLVNSSALTLSHMNVRATVPLTPLQTRPNGPNGGSGGNASGSSGGSGCGGQGGGAGGAGGRDSTTGICDGASSGAGGSGDTSASCGGGYGGAGAIGCGTTTAQNGGDGWACGAAPTPGANGAVVSSHGTVNGASFLWQPNGGQVGSTGGVGRGGGGGGGGGSGNCDTVCTGAPGGVGGGGGGAGCGGFGGPGGLPVGSLFGVFAYNSRVTVLNCVLDVGWANSGNPGSAGGAGGAGGRGASGASGSWPSDSNAFAINPRWSGSGGRGGDGWPGAAGGGGSGAPGGSSIGILMCNSTLGMFTGSTRLPGATPGGAGGGSAPAGIAGRVAATLSVTGAPCVF